MASATDVVRGVANATRQSGQSFGVLGAPRAELAQPRDDVLLLRPDTLCRI
jgi:hypothetical protein